MSGWGIVGSALAGAVSGVGAGIAEVGLEAQKGGRSGIGRMVVDDDEVPGHPGMIKQRAQAPLRPMRLIEYGNHH